MRKSKGFIRSLDPSDPRNPDHPSHEKQWLELAAALGRMMADADWDRLHNSTGEQNDENRRPLRKVLK
jgi:hypothetical protein